MTTPIFAKTHNLIAYLYKPTESEGFEQIIDFLNGSSVRYALIASPTIRTSCIKQFWSTTKVKTVNDEVRVQALIDAKRVNIKKSSICCTLKLDDEEGTSCLANAEIFTGLANMGYEKISDKLNFYKAFFSPQRKFLIHTILQYLSAKTTSWNEFSSTMASAIICLATNQKFNFSRYILLSLVKNIEAGVPFYMFPRFVQLIVDHQLGDMSHHQDICDNPSLTKKVFANMKRVGSGFSGVITPLFENMLVLAAEEVEHIIPSPSNDLIPDADTDSLKFQELMDLCTILSNKVLDLESEVIDIKSSFIDKIEKLEGRVHKLEEENKIHKETSFKSTKIDTAAPAKAYNLDLQHSKKVLSMQDIDEEEPAEVEEVLEVVTAAKLITEEKKGVVIQDLEETTTSVIVHTKVQLKDKEKGILIEEPKPLKGQAQIKQDEAFARQLEAELNANINWNDVIEKVKRSERQDNPVMRYQALKRKPLTEAQERKHMMVYLKNMAGFKMNFFKGMTYSEIGPLFEKHYNSNQAFLERVEEEVTIQEKEIEEEEELKRHLQIVSNDDDDDVYTEATPLASKIMFEKPVIKANVWKDQKGIYGLAKKYPLTHFTLEQMLNYVRLEVKKESEMSLELLSYHPQQGVEDPYQRDSQAGILFLDRKANPDYLTWRKTKSFISNDFPNDGYDLNDVLTLCARFAKLRDIAEAVLVRSGLGSVKFASDDNFSFPILGEEIMLNLFPLAPWPSTWIIPMLMDPSVYKMALDHTITYAELVRTEAMSLLELSTWMSVLTSLLVLHGAKRNVWYTSLTSSTVILQEKVKFKMDQLDKLWSEFSDLKGNYKKAQKECPGCDRENKELQASNYALFVEGTRLKDQLAEAKAAATRSANKLVCSESKLSERALIMRYLENKLVFQESKTQKYKDMAAYPEHHFSDL
nr:hypothetical protein [Tanacetum cinerariifolium]